MWGEEKKDSRVIMKNQKFYLNFQEMSVKLRMNLRHKSNSTINTPINYTMPVNMVIWGELDAQKNANGSIDKFFNLLYSDVRVKTEDRTIQSEEGQNFTSSEMMENIIDDLVDTDF